jgi:DNA-directed RNA polymerase specialized sigma24 family protein
MMDDEQLLHAYARERSESAFGELVTRHIDFVYSTALRVVNGDSHLAQDVAQTVFIELALCRPDKLTRVWPVKLILAGAARRRVFLFPGSG